MELKIESYQLPEKVSFNFEELKNEITAKTAHFESLVYTEEQIKDAKADKAALNKLKKALNDERLKREREYMQPFNEFKAQISEIISIIDKSVQAVDKQVKEYENYRKESKLEEIRAIYNEIGFPDWATPKQIIEENWLNASVSIKAVKSAIEEKKAKIDADLATLANLPEFGFEATEEYKRSLDINKAFSEGYRLAEIQKRKAEEAARKAEQEAAIKAASIATEAAAKAVSEVAETASEAKKQWLSFSALLSIDDAAALKSLFLERNIQFKQI